MSHECSHVNLEELDDLNKQIPLQHKRTGTARDERYIVKMNPVRFEGWVFHE